MANRLFDLGREAFLEGGIDALTDTLKCSLVSNSYTPNFATDQFYNVISGGAIIAAGVALTSKTGSAGTLSAANLIWTSVSGSAASYIVLYKDTGSSSTSPLIGLIDTASGLPITPNGGDITVAWAGGAVFTLRERLKDSQRAQPWAWIKDWFRSPGGLYLPEPRIVMG